MTDSPPTLQTPRGAYYPPTENPKSHCVSVRLDADAYARMQAFFSAFADRKQSTAMRWLLEQPAVNELINAKIREGIS
jgi:hypothetical protein